MAIRKLEVEQEEQGSFEILQSSQGFFSELVEEGFARRQFRPPSSAQVYLVSLLEHYIDARNLFDRDVDELGQRSPSTLAESYLRALDAPRPDRIEALRKLGDRALYISGFFSDSLNRSLVDVDYYAGLGGAAYGNLAEAVSEEEAATVYRVFSKNFLEFADVLSFISQKALVQSHEDVLRLYDKYLRTGSQTARERLLEMGVIPMAQDSLKQSKQD